MGNNGISISVVNGKFDLYLPNGTYELNDYWNNDEQMHNQLSRSFTISNGVLVGNLNIVLPAKNVTGTVRSADGALQSNIYFQLQSVGLSSNMGYLVNVKNGAFSTYLPDASYEVYSYSDQITGLSKPLIGSFKVVNGVSTPASLDLVIHASNVTGTLKNVDGSNISADLSLQLPNANISLSLSVVKGKFDLYLPNGTYEIGGYWDKDNQTYNQLRRSFTVSDGVLVGTLNLVMPAKNMFGTIRKADGTTPSNLSIQFQSVGPDSNQGYYANVKNGEFSMYLPDGSYQVTSYYDGTAGVSKPLLKSCTVTNGVTSPASIDLVIRPSNVSGTLKNADLSNITGRLDIQLQNGNYGLSINVVNGVFAEYLPDGSYQLNGGYRDDISNPYFQLSGTFTVSNGALVGSLNLVAE
jgi:hypothetical protein